MYPLASLVSPSDPACRWAAQRCCGTFSLTDITSDSSDFVEMIAPLSALSNGNSRSPRAKARSKPSSEGTGGLHSAGLGTPAQTSPIATCHLPLAARSPRRSCRCERRAQPSQRQNVGKRLSRYRDLGHLERDVASVPDDLRADLDQLLAQAGQRPLLRHLRHCQR